VLVAEYQGQGRGRLDRRWSSPPRAGLTFSVLVRDLPPAPATWAWLPLVAGLAVRDAVRKLAEVDAVLKWPNDVLVGPARRKVAGILAEAVAGGTPEEAADPGIVVGIGLNVTARRDELPGPHATSLALEGATATDRNPLLAEILRGLAAQVGQWRAAAGDATASGQLAAYAEACATLGQEVSVGLPGGHSFTGTAGAVDADGRLLVDTAQGIRAVAAGDIAHLRSSPA
jgi:BirA family biotin operon repressor/biotin-[acetyl-CoA-carboxylase] ligase